MSETDSSSYLEELESRATMALKQSSKERKVKPPIDTPVKVEHQPPEQVKTQTPEEVKSDTPEKISSTEPSPRKRTQTKVDRQMERTLRKVVSEQTKRTKADLRMLEKVMKKHESKIERMIGDNLGQSTSLQEEVKGLINGQSEELKKSCEDIVVSNSQDELQKLTDWFYDEFMKALDNKSGEYETLKSSSEAQANRMVEEIDSKAKRIKVLDQKIADIASYLPRDVRTELFAELGLEYLDSTIVRSAEKKQARKGIIAKLSSLFKRKPKQATRPSVTKSKKKLDEQKRARKKLVETAEIIAE